MAKITISKVLEAGRVIAALQKAKIEGLEDFVTYLADLSENVIRALKGQLTFRENMLCEERELTLKPGVAQSIQLQSNQSGRLIPRTVLMGRVTPFSAIVTGFNWELKIDGSMSLVVNCSPVPASGSITVNVIILY